MVWDECAAGDRKYDQNKYARSESVTATEGEFGESAAIDLHWRRSRVQRRVCVFDKLRINPLYWTDSNPSR